jgi:hypothetical protein
MKKCLGILLCAIAVSVVAVGHGIDPEPIVLEPVIERLSEEQDGSGHFSITIPDLLEVQAFFPSQPEISECLENDADEEDDEDEDMATCSVMCCVESEGAMGLIFHIPSEFEYDLSRPEERERFIQDTLDEAQQAQEQGFTEGWQVRTARLDPIASQSGESIRVCEIEVLIPYDKMVIRVLHRVYVLRVGVVIAMITQACPDPSHAAVKSDKFQHLLETLKFSY